MKIPLEVFWDQQGRDEGSTASALIREMRTLSRRGRIALIFRVAASYHIRVGHELNIPSLFVVLNIQNLREVCRSEVR